MDLVGVVDVTISIIIHIKYLEYMDEGGFLVENNKEHIHGFGGCDWCYN